MRDLATSGVTMVVVTHEIGFARKVADQLIFLENGVVVEHGLPADLLDRPRTSSLQKFLSGTGMSRSPATGRTKAAET